MANNPNILIIYSLKDQVYQDRLIKHLIAIIPPDSISIWDNRKIFPGDEWEDVLNKQLARANIIILLISADFLASDFCYSRQMEEIMEAHTSGERRVIPLLLRPVFWKDTLFGRLQPLPRDGKPITTKADVDIAFQDVTKSIKRVIKSKELNTDEDTGNSPISAPIHSSGIRETPTSFNPEGTADLKKTTAKLSIADNMANLEDEVRKSYSVIRGYNDLIRVSDDPIEKEQAKRSIKNLSILANHYLDEYKKLAKQVGAHIPADINQISFYIGRVQ